LRLAEATGCRRWSSRASECSGTGATVPWCRWDWSRTSQTQRPQRPDFWKQVGRQVIASQAVEQSPFIGG